MGLAKNRKKKHAAAAVLFLFAFLSLFFLLRGGAGEEPLQGTPVLENAGENIVPLLLAEQDGSALFVCGTGDTSWLLRLDAVTGETEAKLTIDAPLYWAAFRNETLFLREDPGGRAVLISCHSRTLEEISRRELDCSPDSIAFFDCDSQGNAAYVLAGSRSILQLFSADGEKTVREFPGPIEFLEAADDGRLWVYAGKALYIGSADGTFQGISCLGEPYHLLGNRRLIDRAGTVYRLEGTALEPLFRCPNALPDRFSFCLDRENCLIVSKAGGGISRYSPDGDILGGCRLESTALALCAAGGVYRRGGSLFYSPFSFSSPSPEPSLSPSPSPEPEDPPVRTEGTFILIPAGTTADDLRELFKPEAVAIRDLNGNMVLHSRLATGMTAGDWVLVVEGDCNQTGTVNSADLREALSLSLRSPKPEDPCFRAADINNDGLVDTADLVLLSAMLSK